MAKIIGKISQEIIRSLKGQVDFYYWKGKLVCRKWPDWSKFKPSPRQKEAMEVFRKSREILKQVSPRIRRIWQSMTEGNKMAWVDYYTSRFMRYWKNTGKIPPVPLDYEWEEDAEKYTVKVKFSPGTQKKACVCIGEPQRKVVVRREKGTTSICWDFYDAQIIYTTELKPTYLIDWIADGPFPIGDRYREAGGLGSTLQEACEDAWNNLVDQPYSDTPPETQIACYCFGVQMDGFYDAHVWDQHCELMWDISKFREIYPGHTIQGAYLEFTENQVQEKKSKITVDPLGVSIYSVDVPGFLYFTPPASWNEEDHVYLTFYCHPDDYFFCPDQPYHDAGFRMRFFSVFLHILSDKLPFETFTIPKSAIPKNQSVSFILIGEGDNRLASLPLPLIR